jgi:hypothetical protein
MAVTITEETQLQEMRLLILGDSTNTEKDEYFQYYLKQAKNTYLNLVFPFNHTITELPDDRAAEWQTKAAIELYNLSDDVFGDRKNMASYSENGLQITFAKAGLSKDLLSELPPSRAGVPIEEIEETEEEADEEDEEEEEGEGG